MFTVDDMVLAERKGLWRAWGEAHHLKALGKKYGFQRITMTGHYQGSKIVIRQPRKEKATSEHEFLERLHISITGGCRRSDSGWTANSSAGGRLTPVRRA